MIEFIVAVDLRPDTKARHFVSVAQALGRGLVRPCCHARKRDRFSAHRKSQKVPDRLGLLRHVSPPFTHLFPRRANQEGVHRIKVIRRNQEVSGRTLRRVVISGGSAGGYTTLAALTFRDFFQGGASYY